MKPAKRADSEALIQPIVENAILHGVERDWVRAPLLYGRRPRITGIYGHFG